MPIERARAADREAARRDQPDQPREGASPYSAAGSPFQLRSLSEDQACSAPRSRQPWPSSPPHRRPPSRRSPAASTTRAAWRSGPTAPSTCANAGRGGKHCQGKGEDQFCFGMTGGIVKVANGEESTSPRGCCPTAGAGGVFAAGVHGVSVGARRERLRRRTSGPPKDVSVAPRWARRQAGRLFDTATSGRTRGIDLIEWNRNIDKVKGDRNSNPYAVLALADRQIVVDAGANAVLEVRGGKVSLLAVIPKNGKSQPVPTSIAQGPDGRLLRRRAGRGRGQGQGARVADPGRGRHARGVRQRLHGHHRRGLRARRQPVRDRVRAQPAQGGPPRRGRARGARRHAHEARRRQAARADRRGGGRDRRGVRVELQRAARARRRRRARSRERAARW